MINHQIWSNVDIQASLRINQTKIFYNHAQCVMVNEYYLDDDDIILIISNDSCHFNITLYNVWPF